jgi:hypothetical protein
VRKSSDELSEVEKRLLEHIKLGETLTLLEEVPREGINTPKLAVRARVLRDILLGRWVSDLDPYGVRLRGAIIEGPLELTGVRAPVSMHLLMCRLTDTAYLYDAHLPQLVLQDSQVAGIEADRLEVDGSLTARGLRALGPMRLCGARIGGQLNLAGASIEAGADCALRADAAQVASDVLLRPDESRGRFRCQGKTEAALISLSDAQIGGCLDADQAKLVNESGPALIAERAQIAGDLCFRDAEIRGSRSGAVVLTGARVGAQLSCLRSRIAGSNSPALVGDGLHVSGNMFLDIDATGDGPDAVVRLVGSVIEGSLTCGESHVRHEGPSGVALDLRYVTVGKLLSLPPDLGGSGAAEPAGKIALDGLVYPGVPDGPDLNGWLAILRHQIPGYAAQPYRQLAAAYTAAGRERDARRILIAQNDDLIDRDTVRGATRLQHRLMRITLRYGYESWRALAGLGLTVGVAVIFVLLICAPMDLVAQATASGNLPGCPAMEQVGLALNLAIPLVDAASPQQCILITTRTSNEWVIAMGWLFHALGWSFATLFVVGFTGLVRKK